MEVLLVNTPHETLPEWTADLVRDSGWEAATAADYASAIETIRDRPIDVVVLVEPRQQEDRPDSELGRLRRLIGLQRIAGIMLADTLPPTRPDAKTLFDVVGGDIGPAELRGRLCMIERYHQRFQWMEQELRNMERLGKRLNQHFREVDQEMRLAARLQRDFLPRIKDPIRNAAFATIYRPASWVSGDLFDIFRIDEDHTAFYVADAVGHGLAASLLTMFIKRAIVSKHVDGDGYTVLSPSQTMTVLNDTLAAQSLPNCQFVTAWYGLLDHASLTLRYARGGHPYPVLMTADGTISELKSTGGLLGLFSGEEFPTGELQLHPGDKLLLYTDGVETAFQRLDEPHLDTTAYLSTFESLGGLSIHNMFREIETQLDDETGSLSPRDDITLVGVEILDV